MASDPSSHKSTGKADGPALLPLGHHTGKPPVPLYRPVTVVGSRSNARIHLISSTVSKAHALIVHSNGGTYVRDLASRTHVYVNGTQVREADLQDGDLVKIGSFTFKFTTGNRRKRASRGGAARSAELDVTGAPVPVPLDQRVMLIGRRSSADIALLETSASTAHAVIFEMDGDHYVRDLGSRTGTFVNGVSTHQHKLSAGDVVRVGETDIRYQPAAAEAASAGAALAGDSAAAYQLQAPLEEIEPAPASSPEEAETMGGLDLMGELVTDELRREQAAPTRRPDVDADAHADALPLVEVGPADAQAEAAAPDDEAPTAAASAEIDDLAGELLGEATAPAENSSDAATAAETEAQAPDDAEQELHPRRGWRPSRHEQEETGADTDAERAEPEAQEEDRTSDVLRFSESATTVEPSHDDVAAPGGSAAALLDHDALTPPPLPQPLELELEPATEPEHQPEPAEAKFDFTRAVADADSAHAPSGVEPSDVDFSKIDLGLKAEKAAPELPAPAPVEEIEPPPLDFSVKEASASLPNLDEVLPPAPLKLSEDAAALKDATEALTRRQRGRKRKTEKPPVFQDPPPEAFSEVLEGTEPTPESALDLGPTSTPEVPLEDLTSVDALTDTKFAKAVEEFTGKGAGELVEPGAGADEPKAASRKERDVARPGRYPPLGPGANQENFLGGAPLPGSRVRSAPVPLASDPVDELIAEIDSAAEAAERAGAKAPLKDVTGDTDALVDPFSRLGARRPPREAMRRGRPARRTGVELGPLPARIDESIPPFAGGDATAGGITTGFDGLAMPPVRQADVFSQMSPPALAPEGASAGVMTPGLADEAVAAPPTLVASAPASTVAAPVEERAERFGRGADAFFSGQGAEPIESGAVAAAAALAPSGSVAQALEAAEHGPPRRRVRPALPDAPVWPSAPGADRRTPVLMPTEEELEPSPDEIRRRYLKRVPLLIALMLGSIIATWAAVYALVPVRSSVEASVSYRNLSDRTKRDREEIQREQLRRLMDEGTRKAARHKVLQTPEISPGFLDDQLAYMKVAERAHWPDASPGVLMLRYEGRQKDADAARMKALSWALYEQNSAMLQAAKRARSEVEGIQDAIERNEKRLGEIDGEIASQRILYEKRPDADQIKTLEQELAKREEAWKRAVSGVKDAEAELARLKEGGATSGAAQAPQLPPDDELNKMTSELEQLRARVQAARDATSDRAQKARDELDSAMAQFKQQIETAGAMIPGSGEMARYLESAQKLQETTSQLIDDLIRRQEQQCSSLVELKERLNEKMQEHRNEMWQADRELQELTERLAILTRQYNAAVGGGLKQEAEEKRAEVELTRSMIKARQDLIPADRGYAEAIKDIQVVIDSTQKNIDEDRKRTDQLVAALQKGFASEGPRIDALPADQKELAKRIEGNIAAVNAAREKYNRAIEAGTKDEDAQLEQQIAALQSGIEARKKQLIEQLGPPKDRDAAVQAKLAQLDTLKLQQRQTEDAYFAARKELEAARTAVTDARASFEKLEKLEADRTNLQTELKRQSDTLVDRQREAKTAVEPLPPDDNDVVVREGADRRLTVASLGSLPIFLTFLGLIGMAFHRAAREAPIGSLTDLQPISHPVPQPTPSGNGQPGTNGTPDDDDHQPAIV